VSTAAADLMPARGFGRAQRCLKTIIDQVSTLGDGIEYRGRRYHSLSEVARRITGTRWSGPRFFGLKAARKNHVANDGMSLPEVSDESVDLIFSFDSLIHTEADAFASYLLEFRRVLKPGGSGWKTG